MGKSSQRKGRAGELELVQLLRDHGIQAEPGKAVSIGTTPDITGVPGIHAEVKRVEKLNVHTALDQAVRDSEKFQDGRPVLFHRRNREGWLCTLRLEDFLAFYSGQGLLDEAAFLAEQEFGK